MKIRLFASASLILLIFACKHKHQEASPELKKAYKIQLSALKLNNELEYKIKNSNHNIPSELIQVKEVWLKNMVEIPGMDHDHVNCNHDHKRPTISITDKEMIQVQQNWLDSLLVIKNKFEASL